MVHLSFLPNRAPSIPGSTYLYSPDTTVKPSTRLDSVSEKVLLDKQRDFRGAPTPAGLFPPPALHSQGKRRSWEDSVCQAASFLQKLSCQRLKVSPQKTPHKQETFLSMKTMKMNLRRGKKRNLSSHLGLSCSSLPHSYSQHYHQTLDLQEVGIFFELVKWSKFYLSDSFEKCCIFFTSPPPYLGESQCILDTYAHVTSDLINCYITLVFCCLCYCFPFESLPSLICQISYRTARKWCL